MLPPDERWENSKAEKNVKMLLNKISWIDTLNKLKVSLSPELVFFLFQLFGRSFCDYRFVSSFNDKISTE